METNTPTSLCPVADTRSAPGELTIATVETWAPRWHERIVSGAARIDLAGFDRCDAIGLQLLYAARRLARENGQALAFTGVSPALRAIATRIGAHDLFADSSDAQP